MERRRIPLKHPGDRRSAIPMRTPRGHGRAEEVSIGHLARHLLREQVAQAAARPLSEQALERLRAGLRALLSRDLAQAWSWEDLQRRLMVKGFDLMPDAQALILVTRTDKRRLCTLAALGFSDAALARRLGPGAPGDPSPTTRHAAQAPHDQRAGKRTAKISAALSPRASSTPEKE